MTLTASLDYSGTLPPLFPTSPTPRSASSKQCPLSYHMPAPANAAASPIATENNTAAAMNNTISAARISLRLKFLRSGRGPNASGFGPHPVVQLYRNLLKSFELFISKFHGEYVDDLHDLFLLFFLVLQLLDCASIC